MILLIEIDLIKKSKTYTVQTQKSTSNKSINMKVWAVKVETSVLRTESEVERGLRSGSAQYSSQCTVQWPVHGLWMALVMVGAGPERAENLTHQNLCLVAAHSHKHCTTKTKLPSSLLDFPDKLLKFGKIYFTIFWYNMEWRDCKEDHITTKPQQSFQDTLWCQQNRKKHFLI